MKSMKCMSAILLVVSVISCGHAWDSEELEIFDLVEEINRNFYEFMEISQNASTSEIKRAFRTLSIVLHPDKNPNEDANIQFRNLVSIYETLRDQSKREKYDKVLRDGLPNWKSALYYYRRMRKIGLYEGALIVFIVITIGQYLFAWAAYAEKKYTAEQVIGSKLKKLQKKNRNLDMDTILNEIPTPSIFNTLPFQIPLAIWYLPRTIRDAFSKANELKEIALEKRRQEIEAIKRQEELEREAEEQVKLRKEQKENLRKRKQNTKAPEKTDEELRGYAQIHAREITDEDAVKPVERKVTVTGGFWTDEDLVELIRLVKKYPSGSNNRWGTISELMNRSVAEVTFMAAKMKENGYRVPGQTESVAEQIVQATQEVVKKEKAKKTIEKSIVVAETNWTQEQQRALEAAITKYRKNMSGDRWQKIANCVPGKSREECLVRYKNLCELVKSQKETEDSATNATLSNEQQSPPATIVDEATTIETNEPLLPSEVTKVAELDEEMLLESQQKRSKRKERRRRKNLSDDEDSDDIYHYEIS